MPRITLTTTNVDHGGPGNYHPDLEYYPDDEDKVLTHPDAGTGSTLYYYNIYVKVRVSGAAIQPSTPPPNVPVTAKIARKADGTLLNGPTHIAALPCPPYCNDGDTV